MSTSFRITQKSIGIRTLHGLQANLDRLGRLQEQLSSGKQLARPSDSPTGAVSALRFRSEIRSHEQYVRNTDDALGWLGTVDNALTSSLGGHPAGARPRPPGHVVQHRRLAAGPRGDRGRGGAAARAAAGGWPTPRT